VPTERESNTTRVPKSGLARTCLYRWGQLRRHLVPLVPAAVATRTRALRRRAFDSLPAARAPLGLSPGTRARLDTTFAAANQELACWLRDGGEESLPAWLAPPLRAVV